VADKITELSTDRPILEDDLTLTSQSRLFFRAITAQRKSEITQSQ
jgi:hypothetical protein